MKKELKSMLRNKILPTEKIIELENWFDALPEEISSSLDDKDLPQKLGLKVEYVGTKAMDPDVEAELRPIDDTQYNGLIRISSTQKNTLFPYMHEIIHYLRDVGMGNRVQQVFTRKTTGKTETEDEQYVNYLTAGAVMRYQEIKKLLEQYDKSKPKMDEMAFVESICEKYKQDRVAVIRRIGEVRRLRNSRMHGR